MSQIPSSQSAFRLLSEIMALQQRMAAVFAKCIDADLPVSFIILLSYLSRIGNGKAPHELAQILGVARASITHALKNLNNEGLIEIRINPGDKRGKLIFLTEKGAQLQSEAIAQLTPGVDLAVQGLSQEELDQANRAINTVRENLDAMG